jgi:hypothetical protein
MNTYDGLVNDYLRAVEEALAGVPANRRAELLADLSEHIAARRAELSPEQETEVEVRSILELLGDPEELAAEVMLDADPVAPPGPLWPAGALDDSGPPGSSGALGSSGSVGSSGALGRSGSPGALGPPGSSGSLGSSGFPGAPGPSRSSGSLGPSGPLGSGRPGSAGRSEPADALPPSAAPILIQPKKKSAAVIWVVVTIGAVASMCVVAVLLGVFLFAMSRDSSSGEDSPVPRQEVPAPTAAPTSSPS